MFYFSYIDSHIKQMNNILKFIILLIFLIFTIYHNLISNSQIIEIEEEINHLKIEDSLNLNERDLSENNQKAKGTLNITISEKIENLKNRCGDLCNTEKNVTINEGDFLGHIKSNVYNINL